MMRLRTDTGFRGTAAPMGCEAHHLLLLHGASAEGSAPTGFAVSEAG